MMDYMDYDVRTSKSKHSIIFTVSIFCIFLWCYFISGFFSNVIDFAQLLKFLLPFSIITICIIILIKYVKYKKINIFSKYLFFLPALILIGGIIYFPVINTILISFTEQVGLQRGGFNGIKNYITIFSDDVFYSVLLQTFYWTGGVLIFTIIISLYSAHIMNRDFYGKKIIQTVFVLPWATAMIVTAVAYKLIYHGEFGYLNKIIYSFNKNFENIYWLGEPKLVMPSLIFVGIMVSIPFTTITFLAAMKTVPQELYESAEIDGANSIQKFINITIPSIKHVTTVVVLINFIYIFNSFPIIWVLTHGGPVYRSHIMVTYLYEVAFTRLNFGVASAIAVVIFFIILIISVTYVHFAEKE